MRIVELDIRLVRLPTRREHRWASMTGSIGSYVVLRMATDEGVCGWGEATALPQWGGDRGRYYGESPATVVHVVRDLFGPALIGADPTDRAGLARIMDAGVAGHFCAKTAVEAAAADVTARSAGIPVYQLLGGRLRTEIPLAHSIGLIPAGQAAEEAVAAVAEGVRTLKLKVGEDAERDRATVAAVREAVGAEVVLTLDANAGWATVGEACRRIAELEWADIHFVEQPVEGVFEMAEVARRVAVPLMADESVWTARDVLEVWLARAASLCSLYVFKSGGLRGALEADAVASAAGVATNLNGSGETGVGNLANLHVACAMKSLAESCVFPLTGVDGDRPTQVAGAMYTDDLLVASMDFRDGHVQVPDGPGWGIEVDQDKVDRYTVEAVTVGRR